MLRAPWPSTVEKSQSVRIHADGEEYAVLCHGWLPPRSKVAARVRTEAGREDYSIVTAEGRVACSRSLDKKSAGGMWKT